MRSRESRNEGLVQQDSRQPADDGRDRRTGDPHRPRRSRTRSCSQSPLVSKRHAIVTQQNGKLQLENVGINGCMVGETEVLGGQSLEFTPGQQVRIWPYSLTFEAETASVITRLQLEAHLRSIMADLELRIHKQLLERLDLYELESNRVGNTESILLLENNIEDICRELNLFGTENAPLLEEVTGLTLRDYLINQLILEGGRAVLGRRIEAAGALIKNEFDIPATLIAEREAELHELLALHPREAGARPRDSTCRAGFRRSKASSPPCFPWSGRTCTRNCGGI